MTAPDPPADAGVDQALACWGLGLDDVRGFVPPAGPGETVLLVGSVAAGLATRSSDIDLLVIGDRADIHEGLVVREADFDASVLRHADGYRVNVEMWGTPQLEDLEDRVASAMACLLEPDVIHDLHVLRPDEVTLMHRLRTGVVLSNPAVAEAWRLRLHLDGLATYVMLVAAWHCTAHVMDVAGALEADDPASAAWVARSCLDQLAAALLASVGETNPSQRWRVRLLRRHRAALGADVVDTTLRYLFLTPDATAGGGVDAAVAFARQQLDRLLAGRPELGALMSSLATGEVTEPVA